MTTKRLFNCFPTVLLSIVFVMLGRLASAQDLASNDLPLLLDTDAQTNTIINQEFYVKWNDELVVLQDDSKTMWQDFKYDAGNIIGGMIYTYSRPFHWRGEQWRNLGFVAGGTALFYIYDQEISDMFVRNQDDIPKFIKDMGRNYGGTYNFLFTGAVYFSGLFTKNEKLRRTGVLLVSSACASGLLQTTFKYVFGRARPIADEGKNTFKPFQSDRLYHSFPSGHVMMGATNAHALAKQFKSPWIKAGFYAVGAIPAVSRLTEAQHWPTDVVVGIALGIFTVETIDRYLDRKYDEKYNPKDDRVSWDLNFGPGVMGVTARF